MALSPLKKFVLQPVLISAAVFSTLSLPLALMGSKSVSIQIQEEPVFDGRIRDIATPYLGLASLLSIGAGVASAAVMGWRQSERKSAGIEEQLSSLQQQLKQKEAFLEEIKLSEPRLEATGLQVFLYDKESENQELATFIDKKAEVLTIAAMPAPNVESQAIAPQVTEPQPVTPRWIDVQQAVSQFASAQNFLSYTQASLANGKSTTAQGAEMQETAKVTNPAGVEELQSQLKQVMAQLETLQNALQETHLGRA